MLAWILNTKAEKSLLKTSILPMLEFLGNGAEVNRKKLSKNGSTPKLVEALPKILG